MQGLATCVILLWCSFYTTARGHEHGSKDSHRSSHDDICGASHGHRIRRHDRELFPRRPPSSRKYGHALQFEKGQVIQYSKLRSPSKKFSVDFWMRPEGGQHNPAMVLHAYDLCAAENEARGWFVGLREAAATSDLRVTFTVHAASAHSNNTITSHAKLEAGRWVHVAATYDGIRMKLYLNQAEVAVGYGQKGMIFDSSTQGHACDSLEIGGDVKRGLYYRGQIDKLRLWNDAISHRALTQSLPENTIDNRVVKIVMYDDFDKPNEKPVWVALGEQKPHFVLSTVPDDKHDLSIRKPPCGKTICDNPEVIRSYVKHTDNRGTKRLKIRFINVMNDDGSKPTITDRAIHSQFQLLQAFFSQYNITWQRQVKSVRNSWLRSKMLLHLCEASMIGDSICHDQCLFELTGSDGGDCGKRPVKCESEKQGDGVCNPECNNREYEWDSGDCCKTSTSCYDPKSTNRGYVSVNEFKKAVGISNRDALNVYVAESIDHKLQGTATFPWEKEAHTELGGIVLPPKNFATTKVLIHEIGHALGLWHVHHGSSSEMDCSNDCIESFPSLELGDLCSDTNPTSKNTVCADPDVTADTCGLPQYTDTPYRNIMSYANDSCIDHFSPQQVARMHCYIDLDHQSWQIDALPSFVPLSPRVISASKDRVKLSWLPPLGPGGNNARNLCNECEDGHTFEQYATTAYSPILSRPSGEYAPHQATGAPDAEHCSPRARTWRAGDRICREIGDCPLYLEVGFKQAVVPTELTIWVSYEARNAFSDIILIYVDGSTESVGNGTAQCDTPFTKPLNVKRKVSKVRIYVSRPSVCIDAVKLSSGIGHPNCSKCKPLHYVIRRKPAFESGLEMRVTTARFEDKNIDAKGRYEYSVRAVTHDAVSGPFSPPLIYEPKRGFCGDGKIDEGEKCDDGNVRDGDGCNIQCKMEDVFHCDGRPSLCYRHDGDGVCEEFEKKTSIKDCGFYTPPGFRDQWAYEATPNPKYEYTCSHDIIIGPPKHDLKCESDHDTYYVECEDGWSPANTAYLETDLWIKVSFKNPAIASAIIVYLADVLDMTILPPSIKFELSGTSASEKTTVEYSLDKKCKENPITIPIQHDMTKPFFKTHHIKIMFSSDEVKIAAVALRSPKYFDPVALQECTASQLFNPSTQKCHNYQCDIPKCSKLMLKHSQQIEKCKKGSLEGHTCTVKCDKGFTPQTPFELMCSGEEWTVNGEPPHCAPVDCGKPRINNAEMHCRGGTTLGEKCWYKCKEGTRQAGSGADLSVTCEADGLWSAATTFCRKTCPPPPTPPHSILLLASKNCNKGKPFVPGETCKYRCKTGYRHPGRYQKQLGKKVGFVQRCLKSGSWTGKRCVPVRCPVLDPKVYRWYNCTQGDKFGSVCRLACPGEKLREVRCQATGKWDKNFQLCSTKGSCLPPVNHNPDLTVTCGTHMRFGDECKISCMEGFVPVVKDDNSSTPLKSITCSPFLKWYPALQEVKCSLKCINELMDDGICIGENEDSPPYGSSGDDRSSN